MATGLVTIKRKRVVEGVMPQWGKDGHDAQHRGVPEPKSKGGPVK